MQANPLSLLYITWLRQVQYALTPTQLDPLYHVPGYDAASQNETNVSQSTERPYNFH